MAAPLLLTHEEPLPVPSRYKTEAALESGELEAWTKGYMSYEGGTLLPFKNPYAFPAPYEPLLFAAFRLGRTMAWEKFNVSPSERIGR